jgi:putative MATE family efflux protein
MSIKISDHFTYKKLLLFVLPSVLMMVFTSIYGVVDGFFVSNYAGKTAFAAVNFILPFIMILGGMGFMMGTGGSALVAMNLGAGKKERANRFFSMVIEFTIIMGVVLTVFGLAFLKKIAILMGATSDMLPFCLTYGRILLAFITFFMLQNLFQGLMVTAGKPQLGFAITVGAGVLNMFLDFLFVGIFGWGVAGAAVATIISQCFGGITPLIYFSFARNQELRFRIVKMEAGPILHACGNGSSELASDVSSSVVSIVYNAQLLKYAGENGVAAYGVIMYVAFIFIAMFMGYSIGAAPIISYHFGAENHAELQNMRKKSMKIMAVSGVSMMLLAQLLAGTLARMYVGYDQALLTLTVRAFHIFTMAFILSGINIFTSSFFTALNNGPISALISFMRSLVFELLSVLILPLIFGIDGIWSAISVAEIMAFIMSMSFMLKYKSKYNY